MGRYSRVDIHFDKKNHLKPYSYKIPYVPNQSLEEKAFEISKAMVLQDNLKRPRARLNYGQYYKLIYKILCDRTDIYRPTNDLETCFQQNKLFSQNVKPVVRDGVTYIKRWRVGLTGWSKLGIDIDSHDINNLNGVKSFYESVFNYKFTTFKTLNGFWILSNKDYTDKNEWLFDNCRIFNPSLTKAEYYRYKESVLSLDTADHKLTSEEFKNSKYYHGYGSFDIAFVFINIKRGQMTLRISKKTENDKIEVIE